MNTATNLSICDSTELNFRFFCLCTCVFCSVELKVDHHRFKKKKQVSVSEGVSEWPLTMIDGNVEMFETPNSSAGPAAGDNSVLGPRQQPDEAR